MPGVCETGVCWAALRFLDQGKHLMLERDLVTFAPSTGKALILINTGVKSRGNKRYTKMKTGGLSNQEPVINSPSSRF